MVMADTDFIKRLEKNTPIQVRGTAASWIAAPTTTLAAKIQLDDIQALPQGETFLTGVDLALDVVFANTTGTVTVPETLVFGMIDSITCRTKDAHPIFDLGSKAGTVLRAFLWCVMGERPEGANGGGVITITAGGTTAARLKLFLPFMLFGGVEPDDGNVAIRDLTQTAIEFTVPPLGAGGLFDAGATTTVSSGTIRAGVDLCSRSEYRVPTWFTLASVVLSGQEESLAVKDRVLHWLIEVPTQGTATLTEVFITTANRTLVTVLADGTPVTDRQVPADIITRWNRIHARARAEQLAQFEAGTTPFLPVVMPRRRPYKIMGLLRCQAEPVYRVTGTITTPRLVYFTSELNKGPDVIQAINENKVEVPAGFNANPEAFISGKSYAKSQLRPGADGIQRVPIRLHDRPIAPTPSA